MAAETTKVSRGWALATGTNTLAGRTDRMLTSKIEVHQGLAEWGSGGCKEVDAGVPDVGAVAQVQGTQLGCVAQQEPQGGICQLQACQAQLCYPLQPPTALRLPWAGS